MAEDRPMRADARRNAELLVTTARAVFAEKGHTAPLDEIARRAGVGAGTLYRHFPNRDALIQAVYRSDIERLTARAEELLATVPPVDALDTWMREHSRFVRHKRGLAESLGAALALDDESMDRYRAGLREGAGLILAAAQRAGDVRADLEAGDLLRLSAGVAIAAENGTEEESERLLAVMLAGVRALPAPAR